MASDSLRPHIIAMDYDSQYLYVSIGSRDTANREVQPLSRITKYPHNAMHRGVTVDKQELSRVTSEALRSVSQQLNYTPPILVGLHPSSMIGKKITHTIRLTETGGTRTISERDISALESEIEEKIHRQHMNSEILHTIMLQYAIDGEPLPVGTVPVGNMAKQLSAQAFYIVAHSQHRNDCIEALHAENCDIEDVVATPMVVGWQATGQRQRILGCAILYISSETTSLTVFTNNNPVSFHTIPVGIQDIIGDIALGFQIDIHSARGLLSDPDSAYEKGFSKKKFLDILHARYHEISDLTTKQLIQSGWQGLLPAGITLVSTTCQLPGFEDMLRSTTGLPVRTWEGDLPVAPTSKRKQRDIGAIGAYSLSCVYARRTLIFFTRDKIITSMLSGIKDKVKSWFHGLLPE